MYGINACDSHFFSQESDDPCVDSHLCLYPCVCSLCWSWRSSWSRMNVCDDSACHDRPFGTPSSPVCLCPCLCPDLNHCHLTVRRPPAIAITITIPIIVSTVSGKVSFLVANIANTPTYIQLIRSSILQAPFTTTELNFELFTLELFSM